MISPVTAEGDVDEAGVRRVVEHLVEGGVDGFMVLGTNGEGPSFSLPQRRRMVEIGVEQARGRVRVYAGIGATCVSESIAFGRESLEKGVDAVVAHLPPYFPVVPEEMVAYYRLLAERIDGPLFVYNMPPTTHMSIPVESLEELSTDPRIIGVKDSENDLERLERLIDTFRGRPDFSVFIGCAVHGAKTLAYGADGLVPSSGNLMPHLWRRLAATTEAGKEDEARELQEHLNGIAGAYQRGRTLGQGIAALKAGMAARGLCGPGVLPPLRALDEAGQRALREELAGLGVD
jgi:4-hydroxy-tetrahydrodipicolinate synthase